MVRDKVRSDAGQEGWWTWVVVRKDTREAVGSVGFGGGPDTEGAVMIGYATYPNVEGRGYATEAAGALVEWALRQPRRRPRVRQHAARQRRRHPRGPENRHAPARHRLGGGLGRRAAVRHRRVARSGSR